MSDPSILRIIKVGMSRDWARVREYEEQQDERNLDHGVGDIFSQYCDAGVSRCDESVPEPLGGQTYAPGGYSGQGDNEILRGMAGSAPGGLSLVEIRSHWCLRCCPDLPVPSPGSLARSGRVRCLRLLPRLARTQHVACRQSGRGGHVVECNGQVV